jgi:hypothetical protein
VDYQVEKAQLDLKIYKEKKVTRDSLAIMDGLVTLTHLVLQLIEEKKGC